jgi:hypothetical protein
VLKTVIAVLTLVWPNEGLIRIETYPVPPHITREMCQQQMIQAQIIAAQRGAKLKSFICFDDVPA